MTGSAPSSARASIGTSVIADLSRDDPALADFTAYVRDTGSGYASVTVPIEHGVEVSVRS